MIFWAYMNRIRSSRRLETESGRNLKLLWLLRTLRLDHKTIVEFRRRNGEALKNVFKGFVKLGLYGKELLVIDGRATSFNFAE
ncbi:MAG: transposase [Treponema sp.]|nr:transposase [Treponema sp.]